MEGWAEILLDCCSSCSAGTADLRGSSGDSLSSPLQSYRVYKLHSLLGPAEGIAPIPVDVINSDMRPAEFSEVQLILAMSPKWVTYCQEALLPWGQTNPANVAFVVSGVLQGEQYSKKLEAFSERRKASFFKFFVSIRGLTSLKCFN